MYLVGQIYLCIFAYVHPPPPPFRFLLTPLRRFIVVSYPPIAQTLLLDLNRVTQAQAHLTARTLVRRRLHFRSYLALRIVAPLAIYAPLSLSLCLVSLAFNLPFGARCVLSSLFTLRMC